MYSYTMFGLSVWHETTNDSRYWAICTKNTTVGPLLVYLEPLLVMQCFRSSFCSWCWCWWRELLLMLWSSSMCILFLFLCLLLYFMVVAEEWSRPNRACRQVQKRSSTPLNNIGRTDWKFGNVVLFFLCFYFV